MKEIFVIIGDPEAPLYSFRYNEIERCNIESASDIIAQELSIDTAEVSVICNDESIRELPYATGILIYHGERYLGKFYTTRIERIKRNGYRITAVSALGIFGHETFYGGMYTGETFDTVFKQIIKSNGLALYAGYYNSISGRKKALNIGNLSYVQNSATYYSPSLSATMRSRMKAKVKVTGFVSGATYPLTILGTSWDVAILGCVYNSVPNSDETLKAHQYCFGVNITYDRTSKVWNTTDAYIRYGTQRISLGTFAFGNTYDIDINPSAGKATVNGTQYTITASTSTKLIPIHQCGGGGDLIMATGDASAIPPFNSRTQYDVFSCQFWNYELYAWDGTPQCRVGYVEDIVSGRVYAYDFVNRIRSIEYAYGSASGDIVAVNENEYPEFHSQTAVEKEIENTLLCSERVAPLLIRGWIPICTKREALHQLLVAEGAIIKKTESGEWIISDPDTVTVGSVSDDRVYLGGSERMGTSVRAIEVTEHGYTYEYATDPVVVFENSAGASQVGIAVFDHAPVNVSSITADGLSISARNCNAAIVSGSGTISGKPYEHSEVIVSRQIGVDPEGQIISVNDATLITLLNSQTLIDRLESYYSSARTLKLDIVETDEQCGLMYEVPNPYDERENGYLTKKSESLSGIIKAGCEFVTGYIPTQAGEGYTGYVILTGSGTWEVPAEVFQKQSPRIRAILIGGGSGGSSGYAGHPGAVPDVGAVETEPAEGGLGGNPGSGGKIFDITIDNPAQQYTYNCGTGGEGGAISRSTEVSNPGTAGTATQFSDGTNSYTSNAGASSESGVVNIFTLDVYAKRFKDGFWNTENETLYTSYGKGGKGGYIRNVEGNSFVRENGFICVSTVGAGDGYFGLHGANSPSSGEVARGGGLGGGGAFGQSGSRGGDATSTKAGNGGKGADAVGVPKKATEYNHKYYGYGGSGGGGGGGGGSAGIVIVGEVGTGGAGGYGGKGGSGGDGCVLIYY